MKKRNMVLGSMLVMVLLFGSLAYAQNPAGQGKGKGLPPPEQNISAKRHPNLAAAQRLLDQAFNKIEAGQRANEFDLEGHAAKAKSLIDEASKELKQAAEASKKEHK